MERLLSEKDVIADALFDCYRGYDAETGSRLKMQSEYQRRAQADRVITALTNAGYEIVKAK